MTNLLPQQRFFAIIIFISFCLHTALFISGTVKQTAKSRVYKSERILTQLSNEFAFPLVYKDRVSLSVIANSYAKQYDINRILIRNAKGELLVQSGIDPMLGGESFERDIRVNKSLIGHIEITLKSASNAEIIKFLWLFIATSLIIHLGVWFLYLSCSSPTEEDLQKIRDEVAEEFSQQQKAIESEQLSKENPLPIVQRSRKQAPKKVLMELADYIIEYKQNPQKQQAQVQAEMVKNLPLEETPTEQISTEVEKKSIETIKEKQAEKVATNIDENKAKEAEKVTEDVNTDNKIIGANKNRGGATKITPKGHAMLFARNASKTKPKPSAISNVDIDKQAKKIVQVKQSILMKKGHNRPSLLSGKRPFTKLALEFKYVDKYNLLDKVMPAVVSPYFELCSQFLQITINQLLTDKRLQGVTLVNQPTFSIEGAKVELQTTSNDQKQLLLASTMLAVLYQMINQVIYDTRREAEMFAFNMNIGIADIEQESILGDFSEFNEYENVIISLQYSELKLIEKEVIITKNTEQKYHYVSNMKDDILLTLIRIRNNILEME